MASMEELVKVLIEVLTKATSGGDAGRRKVIEEKHFKRLDSFKGGSMEWRDWSFQAKTVLRSIDNNFAEYLDLVEKQVDYDGKQVVDEDMDIEVTWDHIQQAAREFYNVLCIVCSGEALMIIRGVEDSDGGEAWHRLKRRYYPSTISSMLKKVMVVVATEKTKMQQLPGSIGRWEGAVREVERDLGKELPEVVKVAALVQMCPSDIQDVLFQQAEKLTTVKEAKDRVLALVSNRQAMNEPVAMEVGIVNEEDEYYVDAVGANAICYNCGGKGHLARQCPTKGKSKGKGDPATGAKAKGKGKKGGDTSTKGKGKGGYQGVCWNCNRVGHKAHECQLQGKGQIQWVGYQENTEGEPIETKEVDSVWVIGAVEAVKVEDKDKAKEEGGRGGWRQVKRQAMRREEKPEKQVEVLDLVRPMCVHSNMFRALEDDNSESNDAECTFECGVGLHGAAEIRWGLGGELCMGSCSSFGVEGAKGMGCVLGSRGHLPREAGGGECSRVMKPHEYRGKARERCSKAEEKEEAGGKKAGKEQLEREKRRREAGWSEERMTAEVEKEKEGKSSCKMTFHMTDAKKMLASVNRIVEAGNEVIFGKRSWIKNKESGKRIELKKEGNVFVMKVVFKDGEVKKRGKIVVDSGAAENVMPWSWLEHSKTMERQEGIHFVAANGGSMGNYGRRIVEFEPMHEEEGEEQGFQRHA